MYVRAYVCDSMAEWLRRWIRNPMGFALAFGGSNPSAVAYARTYHILCYIYIIPAWMAEWSKAADLSSVIFGCVGSNPTSGTQHN